jgi:hypothetical protein
MPLVRDPLWDRRSSRAGVRRPYQKPSRPGGGEGDARPVARGGDRGPSAPVSLEHQVRSPTQSHRGVGTRVLQPPDVVDPRPAAFTTARTPTSMRLSTAAPASPAPRRFARQSRTSSVWASG